MNIHFQQDSRQARVLTDLGDDELALLRFNGTEQVNTLFEFRVEALSKRGDIDFDDLIGTHMSAEVDHPDHGAQPFDGIVTQARFLGVGETGYRYDFELRPWFWLAGKRRNQRIFHEKTVVEILNELFEPYADMGAPALEMRLQRDYPKLEYTVQFAESDLDFACRMMERFGLSYTFLHDRQSHTMVIVDQPASFEPVPGLRRPFYSADEHRNVEIEHFWQWRPERNFTTGKIRLTDYNFKRPGAKMETATRGDAKYAHGDIESYDWPGRYLDLSRGEEAEIGLRVTQERGQDRRHYASGDCLTLRAGRRVELSGDAVHDATGEVFACMSAQHRYVSNNYATGARQTDETGYSGDYVLMPETAPLAPRRKTALARVHGPQTARVVGEGEIDCDEYGRILVRFHWDLDDAYSMRCRVSQNWAGNGWGGMVIPRIGMEVLVEFLDGDPDKPLVTGCVYNGRNKVPYDLPQHKTRSTFKSDTHEGKGYNELRFEDKNHQEEIFVHAEKDMNSEVENDRTEFVGRNDATHIGRSQFNEVRHNRHDRVGMSRYSEVRGDRYDLIGGLPYVPSVRATADNRAESIWSRFIRLPKLAGVGNWISHVTGYRISSTVMDDIEQVNGTKSISTGAQMNLTSNASASLSARENIIIDADQSVTIRSGDSALVLKENGKILLTGKQLYFSSEETDIEADKNVRVKSGRIDLN